MRTASAENINVFRELKETCFFGANSESFAFCKFHQRHIKPATDALGQIIVTTPRGAVITAAAGNRMTKDKRLYH